MSTAIEKLSFGGILDKSFQLMRENFTVIAGAYACFAIPTHLANQWLMEGISATGREEMGVEELKALYFGQAGKSLLILALMFFMPLIMVTTARLVSNAYLSRPEPSSAAFSLAKKQYWKLLATILIMVGMLIPAFVLLAFPGLYLMTCWMFLFSVFSEEQLWGMRALRRSRQLLKGYFWRGVGLWFVVAIIVAIISMALQSLFSSIPFLGPLLSGALATVTGSFQVCVLVVFYYDLRCRKEDFDITHLAEQVASPQPDAVTA